MVANFGYRSNPWWWWRKPLQYTIPLFFSRYWPTDCFPSIFEELPLKYPRWGMIVSKRIKAFLRKFTPNAHWHRRPYKALDTYFCFDPWFCPTNAFWVLFETSSAAKSFQLHQPFGLVPSKRSEGDKQTQFELKMPYSILVYAQIFPKHSYGLTSTIGQ